MAKDTLATGPQPPNKVGHQGLFYEHLDTGDGLIVGAIGLYYNRNRWYSPALGRFTSRDPNETAMPIIETLVTNAEVFAIATDGFDGMGHYADGLNPYAYARSSPTTYNDPSGSVAMYLMLFESETNEAYIWGAAGASAAKLGKTLLSRMMDFAAAVEQRNLTLDAVADIAANAGGQSLDFLTGSGAGLMTKFGGASMKALREVGRRRRELLQFMSQGAGGPTEGHHMIPTQTLDRLRRDAPRVYRQVVGKRGERNVFEIPKALHDYLHHGGGGYGGWWNRIWRDAVTDMLARRLADAEMVRELKLLREMLLVELGVSARGTGQELEQDKWRSMN